MKHIVVVWFAVMMCASQSFGALGLSYRAPAGPTAEQIAEAKRQQEVEQQAWIDRQNQKTGFSRDPFRMIDGEIVGIGSNWVTFSGKVLQVVDDGVRFNGRYVPLNNPSKVYEGEFFVANFPYVAAEDDFFPTAHYLTAKSAETYTYTTVQNASRTIRKLDYGKVWTPPPPSAGEIAAKRDAAKKAAEKKKAEQSLKTLKFHQDLAEKGDAYGQLRMGERYMKGDGVEKDETKARQLLKASADQGNAEAAKMLGTDTAGK